jgi:hypothetical protein
VIGVFGSQFPVGTTTSDPDLATVDPYLADRLTADEAIIDLNKRATRENTNGFDWSFSGIDATPTPPA